MAGQSVLIVNVLNYEVDFKCRLKLYRDEQFLKEVGMEFHVPYVYASEVRCVLKVPVQCPTFYA